VKRSQRKLNYAHIYYKNLSGYDAIREIKSMESLNLEAVKEVTGSLPKWNLKRGSSEVLNSLWGKYYQGTDEYLKLAGLLCNRTSNLNVARSSIRELHKDVEYRIIESFLHGLRMNILPFKEAIEFFLELGGFADTIKLIESINYLNKKPNI